MTRVNLATAEGTPVVRKFPFAYDTANILTGAEVYTPTVGDILLDAWVEIDTAWDGFTPLGDFATFTDGNLGLFRVACQSPLQMNQPDGSESNLSFGQMFSDLRMAAAAMSGAGGMLNVPAIPSVPTSQQYLVNAAPLGQLLGYASRYLPARHLTADPIKVCVSQDGTNTGADPGSSQGAGILYLVTVTPV